MKYLDNFLPVVAFGLCTITLASFLGATAGRAYGALGEYDRELIALTSKPLLSGVVSAESEPNARNDPSGTQMVHLEPPTVMGHRHETNYQPSHVAHEPAPASPNVLRGKS